MQDDLQQVLEKDKKRLLVLKAIYDQTQGDKHTPTIFSEVYEATGVNGEEGQELIRILEYLAAKGLIKIQGSIYGGQSAPIWICHEGIREFEQTIRNPNGSTEHFSGSVVQNFHAAVGAVQNGNYNRAEVTQHIGMDAAEVLKLIQKLEQEVPNIPQENQDVAADSIEVLKAEVVATPTKVARIKGALFALWTSGKDVASFINAVTAIAERFHIHLPLQ
uniref:hypothetical protein n=1 Tax=Trichocoleus desertorum TaxID=1481672 RepID=UPI0025B474EF|nr:hypothetical protein [Trichocoleus desertorum]